MVATWDWVGNPVGTITSGPEAQQTLQGIKAQYFIRFEPPAYDRQGEGPFRVGPAFDSELELADATGTPS